MRVLLCNTRFGGLTGSELQILDHAKELIRLGHEVAIETQKAPTGPLLPKAQGIHLGGMSNPDVLHLGQPKIAKHVLDRYPGVPAVQSVLSEIRNIEAPVKHDQILHYIANRPSVKELLISRDTIPAENISHIWSGIDVSRFSSIKSTARDRLVLFVGSVDSLREKAMIDVVSLPQRVRIVGTASRDVKRKSNVEVWSPRVDIEEAMKDATHTASIFVGRSTIEGWAAGLPGYVYVVDSSGTILERQHFDVPEIMSQFDVKHTTAQTIEVYKKVLS